MTTSARDFQFSPYLPRYLATWQSRPEAGGHHIVDGTVLFADVSRFTRLSDELAKQGKIGRWAATGTTPWTVETATTPSTGGWGGTPSPEVRVKTCSTGATESTAAWRVSS